MTAFVANDRIYSPHVAVGTILLDIAELDAERIRNLDSTLKNSWVIVIFGSLYNTYSHETF